MGCSWSVKIERSRSEVFARGSIVVSAGMKRELLKGVLVVADLVGGTP